MMPAITYKKENVMFIVVNEDHGETINLSNFNLWRVFPNTNNGYSIFAYSRAKDVLADDEKNMLGDVALLGAYSTEIAAKQVLDELNQAIIEGKKVFEMPCRESD